MADAGFLGRAIERGILTLSQAEALTALARETDGPLGPDLSDDDERVRFLTGFADIFVTIGVLLVLGTAGVLAADALGKAAAWALVAALAWGLAELFSRRRRMALPSIVLLVAFVLGAFVAAGTWLGGDLGWRAPLPGSRDADPLPYVGAALAALVLTVLHYRRFRVPITVAAGTATLVAAAAWLIGAALPVDAASSRNAVLALLGLGVFALAMRYDLSDPQRLTRRSDIAFWLHMLAAPLIVHPALGLVQPRLVGVSPGGAMMVLGLVLILALVALATDRRAILVSGLAYAGVALGTLIREAGFATRAAPLSLLALGLFVLALSVAWKPLRGAVLVALPAPFAARLPRPIGTR